MVEVKSRLRTVFATEPAPGAELAELHPGGLILCNAAGPEGTNSSDWVARPDLYTRLGRELVAMRRREEIARSYSTW